MADSYIQHNPNVPGGREGFKKFFGALPNRKPEPIKEEWKNPPTLTLVSGPYVFYMWDRKEKDPADPTKEYTWDHFDMVRVEKRQNPGALGRSEEESAATGAITKGSRTRQWKFTSPQTCKRSSTRWPETPDARVANWSKMQ